MEAEQLRHTTVQITQRIRIADLMAQGELRALGLPARTASEIAGAVERQYRGLIEGRGIVSGGGVGVMVLYRHDPRIRTQVAHRHLYAVSARPLGKRPRQCNRIDISRGRAG